MTLSIVALILGVLAYGGAGARLSDGAQGEAHPLKSFAWWVGTGLQGLGFILTLLARQHLPLLIVQAAVVGALAVTALIQHAAGTRRLRWVDGWAIFVVILGIALLAATTVPGPAVPIAVNHLIVLGGGVVLCLATLPVISNPGVSGLLSGLGFAISAITARLLVADVAHAIWRFWEWPWTSWVAAFLLVAGLGLGQVHLTRGLARSHAVGVLGTNYLASTVVPAGIGAFMLGEAPREGTWWMVILGLCLALAGSLSLLRPEAVAEPENAPAPR
ncbi:hypothetical protein [Gephyromycinifex aptenodytis]|uniref:hypothetical protein n=1 Tax=Gephyromycinifex aptenodytis TaxID=2716227 RepID=UPI00144808D1|nr:hypothetical protein [Gephyromycinifex aptenodytis]